MIWSILGRTYMAHAALMTETDSEALLRKLYENYMKKKFPKFNPYDLPPPPAEGVMADKTFDMPFIPDKSRDDNGKYPLNAHPALIKKRIGYFYCPRAAIAWYKVKENRELYLKHNTTEWTPHDPEGKGTTDFGDFTIEVGIDKKFEYYPVEAAFIAKKCYYISRHEDLKHPGPKMRFKGVGKMTKDATELVAFLTSKMEYKSSFGDGIATPGDMSQVLMLRPDGDPEKREFIKIMKKITLAPSIISRDFYLKLSQGQAQVACEHRFRGCLADIVNDGYGLYASWIIKRIQPSNKYKLIVRTRKDGDNIHGNTIYEHQYPASEPKGKPPCTVMLDDKKVSKEEMRAILNTVTITKKNFAGLTTRLLSGKTVYITPPTVEFIIRFARYFSELYV